MPKREDLTGQVFHYLTVQKEYDKSQDTTIKGGVHWTCLCKCGNNAIISTSQLKKGTTKSCGCLKASKIEAAKLDFIGQKIGKLLILKEAEPIIKNNQKRIAYLCACDCGSEAVVAKEQLQNNTKSCGCLVIENGSKLGASRRVYQQPEEASAMILYKRKYSDGNLSFDDFFRTSRKDCYDCGAKPNKLFNKYENRGESKTSQFAIDNGDFIYHELYKIVSGQKHNIVPRCQSCALSEPNYDSKAVEIG